MGRPCYDENGIRQPQLRRWTKLCEYCGQAFESNRDDAKTCSGSCRTALHRQRIKAARVSIL